MRERYRGLDGGKVNVDHFGVFRIFVGFINMVGAVDSTCHIILGYFVHGEDAVFCSSFNGHIGHAEAIIHGEVF